MKGEKDKYSGIAQKVIGCAMKVHSYFGPGFPETIYQRALLIELRKAGLKCESEVERDVYYEGQLVGKRRLDVIVEDKVLGQLKALSEPDAAGYNKTLNSLRVFFYGSRFVAQLRYGPIAIQTFRELNQYSSLSSVRLPSVPSFSHPCNL